MRTMYLTHTSQDWWAGNFNSYVALKFLFYGWRKNKTKQKLWTSLDPAEAEVGAVAKADQKFPLFEGFG